MLIITSDKIDKEYEILGVCEGNVVTSKHIGKDFMSSLKTIVGGELKAYTEMMSEARNIAKKRMIDEAEKIGADAIIAVRYASSAIVQGSSEIIVYGTAIKFK